MQKQKKAEIVPILFTVNGFTIRVIFRARHSPGRSRVIITVRLTSQFVGSGRKFCHPLWRRSTRSTGHNFHAYANFCVQLILICLIGDNDVNYTKLDFCRIKTLAVILTIVSICRYCHLLFCLAYNASILLAFFVVVTLKRAHFILTQSYMFGLGKYNRIDDIFFYL